MLLTVFIAHWALSSPSWPSKRQKGAVIPVKCSVCPPSLFLSVSCVWLRQLWRAILRQQLTDSQTHTFTRDTSEVKLATCGQPMGDGDAPYAQHRHMEESQRAVHAHTHRQSSKWRVSVSDHKDSSSLSLSHSLAHTEEQQPQLSISTSSLHHSETRAVWRAAARVIFQ